MRMCWLTWMVVLAFTGSTILPAMASRTIDLSDTEAYQAGYQQAAENSAQYEEQTEKKQEEDEEDALNGLLLACGAVIIVGLVYYFFFRDRGDKQAQAPAENKAAIMAGRTWDVTLSPVSVKEADPSEESAALAFEPSVNVCWRF